MDAPGGDIRRGGGGAVRERRAGGEPGASGAAGADDGHAADRGEQLRGALPGAEAGVNVVTVTARDAAGNAGTRTLTVTYDATAPTVAITAPAAGATVAGAVTVTANASDSVGVVGVKGRLEGAA